MEISQRFRGGAIGRSRSSAAARWFAWPSLPVCLTLVAILAALIGIAAWLGNATAFYSVDGDIKYLGALNIARHFANPAIDYPALRFDPAGRYSLPLTAWYGGHDYAGYSLPFLYMAAAAVKLFGAAGLVLPSIVATMLLLWTQLRLARLLELRASRTLLLIASVAATPLLFYSVSFWEHTWGVALLLGGVTLLLEAAIGTAWSRVAAGGAGVCFAGAVLMRRDTLIPALLFLGLLPLVIRRRRVVPLCGLAAVFFLVPIGAILLLHPQPLALGLTHATPGRAGVGVTQGLSKLDKLRFLLSGGWASGLVGGLLAGVAASHRWAPRVTIPLLAAGSLAAGLALAAVMLTGYSFSNENVLAFSPLAIWGLALPLIGWERRGEEGAGSTVINVSVLLWLLAVLGCVAVVMMAYDSGGAQWGPRYLLFSFPPLILLALKARERMVSAAGSPGIGRTVNYSFVGLLALSLLLQGLGLFALSVKQNLAARADRAIAATRADLVVSAFPVIDVLAPTYESHTYLYAPTERELQALMARLRAAGRHRLVLLCDPVNPCRWNGYSGWTHGQVTIIKHAIRFAVYTTG